MNILARIKGMDIYLLDQVLKERISSNSKILDAGCGTGRNLLALHHLGYHVWGIDPNAEVIETLQLNHPELKLRLSCSPIEHYASSEKFDFIICNAVLHFSRSDAHFQEQINALVQCLAQNGILFIRMTSVFASNPTFERNKFGRTNLPDMTQRYLLNQENLDLFLERHQLKLIEPVKTVNVENKRCMTTLVIRKN